MAQCLVRASAFLKKIDERTRHFESLTGNGQGSDYLKRPVRRLGELVADRKSEAGQDVARLSERCVFFKQYRMPPVGEDGHSATLGSTYQT